MRREWEEAHTVTEELVEGPPSRRANATLTACPNGNHLWCIGGEYFSEDGKAVSMDHWRWRLSMRRRHRRITVLTFIYPVLLQ
jgi:hypothetical protein